MAEPLKNMYNPAFVRLLTNAVKNVYPAFDGETFNRAIFDDKWESRELKDRMRHITISLHDCLPDDYIEALAILREAATSPAFDETDYEIMIFPDFVEVYGLDHWEPSMKALEQFTQQSSGEFAVRPFIEQDEERMMAQMLDWTAHDSHHVRRLASEGCRPRLPWAMSLPKFKKDPSPILPILEALKDDKTDYVRRSVGNNLNDIAKDHPQVVIDTLTAWQSNPTYEIRWITSHGLRTLAKDGNADALALLGFDPPQVSINNFTVEPGSIAMGEEITLAFDLQADSKTDQRLMVDYIMHFVRAKGKMGRKVFKLNKMTLSANETVPISTKYSFKPISTRRYYPGTHAVEIQVNGKIVARETFELTAE